MAARDLHDRSSAAVRERQAYWRQRASAERVERARAPKAKGTDVGKLIGKALPKPGQLGGAVRHPRAYARTQPVPAALLLFTGLVTLAVLRRGELPSGRGLISIAGASFVVVLAASIAPDIVVALLGLALLVAVLESVDAIKTVVSLGTARFSEAFAPATGG